MTESREGNTIMTRLLSALALIGSLAIGAMASPARAIDLPGPLVSTEWLATHLEEVLVLDVRNDDTSYREGGHIIGAIRVDFRRARGTAMERGVQLVDMSIPPDAFAALMREAGLGGDRPVVLTHRGRSPDDAGYAAYVYWQLRMAGFDHVAILDGGTTKWIAEGREVWGEDETATPGDFRAGETRRQFLADTAQVEGVVRDRSGEVVDARAFAFFVGLERRPAIPKAGHIPGATLFSFDANFNADGSFRSAEALGRAAEAVGLSSSRPVVVYCNTGHVSAITWFVLHELLGYRDVSLYDGSMLAWARHDLPVETRLR